MRVIAKKANTTLGNIYHYFPNKEAILSEILEEPLEKLSKLVEGHLELQVKAYTMDELLDALKEMNDLSNYEEFQYVLDERLLILFELRTTRFIEAREAFVKKFKNHMAWHLNMEDSDSPYIDILTSTFISCIRHVLLEHKDSEDAQKEFIKVFKMLCTGLAVNAEKL
ncbi:TetR/AcrR family transcriptional regulator [Extibacter muris]|nr:TetR/AcrR family transcriptional regulator [Extibacter muris]MCU0078054.1 TetR/AcrR family transcriptional regulator [Extibacter muris]